MAYIPPSVGPQGLTIPAYADILSDLTTRFQAIYGQSVYLGIDSADYQMLSIFALKMADTLLAAQLSYNGRSPQTAVGAALDSIVKLNGLTRLASSPSTATVTLTGTPGAVITNGTVRDANNYLWDLPTQVTIGSGGNVSVTATCETQGAISAPVGTITGIATPTAGWISVTNASAAVLGTSIETDSGLRARQGISASLPGLTMAASVQAAIAAVTGVTRYRVIENPTGTADAYGNPAHSLTCIVEGGTPLAIATAIYTKRGIGCQTNGTSSQVVTDSYTGQQMTIYYSLPTYIPIYASLNVHGLNGFTTSYVTQIQAAVANYLNGLAIGEEVTISALYGAALAVMPNLLQPTFSIQALGAGTSYTSVTTTASVTSGSTSATVTSATGIVAGMSVTGTGIATGTTVASISGTTVTLSLAATATNASASLTFATVLGTTDVTIGFNAVAQGATANVIVNQV